jgi:hypothetical protein
LSHQKSNDVRNAISSADGREWSAHVAQVRDDPRRQISLKDASLRHCGVHALAEVLDANRSKLRGSSRTIH